MHFACFRLLFMLTPSSFRSLDSWYSSSWEYELGELGRKFQRRGATRILEVYEMHVTVET
jgi:hypothetical protein